MLSFCQASAPRALLLLILLLLQQASVAAQRKDDQPQMDHAKFVEDLDWDDFKYGESFDIQWRSAADNSPTIAFGSPDQLSSVIPIDIGNTDWPYVHTGVKLKSKPPVDHDFYFSIYDNVRETWEFSPRLTFDKSGQAERHEQPYGTQLQELLHWKDPQEYPPPTTEKSTTATRSTKDSSTRLSTTAENTSSTETEAEKKPSSSSGSSSPTSASAPTGTTRDEATSTGGEQAKKTNEPANSSHDGSDGLALGAKIGIGCAAGFAGLGLLAAIGMFFYRRAQREGTRGSRSPSESPHPQPQEKYPWPEPTLPSTEPPYEAPTAVPVELAADPVFVGKTQDVDELFKPRQQPPLGAGRFYKRSSRG